MVSSARAPHSENSSVKDSSQTPSWGMADDTSDGIGQMPRSLVKGLKQTMVLVSRTPSTFWMLSQT